MPPANQRKAARITVDGTGKTHMLVSATPPSITPNVGRTASGQGIPARNIDELNPIEFGFVLEGDDPDLDNQMDPITVQYEEDTFTPGETDRGTINRQVTGLITSIVRADFVARRNTLPTVTYTIDVDQYNMSRGDTVVWDIDTTSNPAKVHHLGKDYFTGADVTA